MLDWLMRRRPTARKPPEPVAEVTSEVTTREPPVTRGASAPLHKYLKGRYADALVLTFGEIEDLLGFPLPELARRSEIWWTNPDSNSADARLADAWILANRTARPNLGALTVAFDRTT